MLRQDEPLFLDPRPIAKTHRRDHDCHYTATLGIPLRSQSIVALVDHYFETPAGLPTALVISVASTTYDPLHHRGSMQAVSPEELRAAFLLAVARDIKLHKDPEIKEWRRHALSTTATFVLDATSESK